MLQYVDLILHHFPCRRGGNNKAVWAGLQEAHANGLARAIGVSNYEVFDLEQILSLGKPTPAVNQCLLSVGAHDDDTIKYCKKNGITYQSYSPLRRVNLEGEAIKKIAANHGDNIGCFYTYNISFRIVYPYFQNDYYIGISTAQVALRWITQQGLPVAVSPGTNTNFIDEDLSTFAFNLTATEMETLSKI